MKARKIPEGNAKSVDALYSLKSGKLCMVEFKNGDFTSADIIEKALSSILFFNEITNTNIEFVRKQMDFVLVYNPDVKKPNPRQKAAKGKSKLAGIKYSMFNLEHLYKFCFSNVAEVKKNEFDETDYVKNIKGR